MDRTNKAFFMELKRFMGFLGRATELDDQSFTTAKSVDVALEDVQRYFNLKAFGTMTPTATCLTMHARANTLKGMKKMLNMYMPGRLIPWDDIRRDDNPTRSAIVDDVIKTVMEYEVRKQGVESKARRLIEYT
ncbi:unnamed protein product [Aphanomyces euteiches]|uniref:Uncharacterized protein n=1 Tax=Aphanomyces euteiches TaxID=100861 RepID=A0A6G0WD03_9STRA|nr:hypothetical protein Ae201684_016584 [Aphanomyces euteiches]KAH9084262.1 hypothetical protein Ae201684P_020511 [Aphanomyces euteiches]KAH9144499.1 hypothetical protein AeRB84_011552 [Aphanomyces euteiches]